jgi:hypothetical protein
VPADGHRLREGRDLRAQAVGDSHHQRLLDQHLLRVGTRRVHRQAEEIDGTRAAEHRHSDDTRAGRQALAAPGAVLGHLATELVAEDDRLI